MRTFENTPGKSMTWVLHLNMDHLPQTCFEGKIDENLTLVLAMNEQTTELYMAPLSLNSLLL